MDRGNLAARAGRWSAAHWKTATFAWIVFVIASVAIGSAAGVVKLSDAENATGEASRAQAILQSAGFSQPADENVLVQSKTLTVADPAFRATIDRVAAKLRTLPQVQQVRSPLTPAAAKAVSPDRHAALVQFSIRGKADSADKRIQPVMDSVATLQKQNPQFTVAEFGFASANHELNNTIGKDFQKAERLTVPITFLILLFVFGAFVAAGIPVLLAFTAVLASIGLAEATSHLAHLSDSTNSVILLMGMAVGVDYSLFYLKREREERHAGHGDDALPRAAATSGQAVLISGGTVLIAMAGMLLSGSKIFTSIGIGAMLVVFAAMVGSLTVLPALLGKLGDRVERGIVAVTAAGAAPGSPPRPAAARMARAAARAEDVPAPPQGRPHRVPRLGPHPRSRAAASGDLGRALRGVPRRPGAAGAGHPHEAAELHRPSAQHPDREHVHRRSRRSSRARRRRRRSSSRRRTSRRRRCSRRSACSSSGRSPPAGCSSRSSSS